jgi:CRP-like cAMP-binding protein
MQITTEWLPAEGALRPVSDASMPVSDIVAPPFRNQLLAGLTLDELDQLRPSLTPVKLARNQLLFTPGEPVEHVYFIEHGITSLLTDIGADRAGIEVAMIGPEGMVGVIALLGAHPIACHRAVVQAPGSALQMPVTSFRDCLDCMPALRERCLSYLSTVIVQISRTAACISRHHLNERCADRLLAARDRMESRTVPLTHSMLATILGVRRAGVTVAVGALQNAGLVRCGRGNIEVLDHTSLEQVACGCHQLIRGQFDQLLMCS